MSKPVEIEFLMKDSLTPGMNKAEREALELRNNVRLLEAELERLRLAGESAAPNFDQRANIAQIAALEKQLDGLRGELKRLQEETESVQVAPSDIPHAQRQFNGLHNSIQQMAREMPSLAMGPQMFFLAISNNLPIFADEVGRARKEYDDLVKSGKKGVPVWKQIVTSLFSWQTALTTGIMLLVMYGDEIWGWTKDLIGAKDGVDGLRKAMEAKNEVEKEAHAISIQTRAELDSLIREINTFTGTKEQEKSKVEELNRKYGDSFGYYETLAEWYDIIIKKGDIYIDSLFAQAKAQAYIKKAVEIDEQINDVKAKGKEEFRPFFGDGGKINMFFGGDNIGHYGSDPAEVAYKKKLEELDEEKQFNLKQAEWFQNEFVRKSKEGSLDDYRPMRSESAKDDPKGEAESKIRAEKEAWKQLRGLRQQNSQAYLALMKDGAEKKLAQIYADYKAQKDEIAKQARELAEANKEAGMAGVNGNGLTTDQQTEIDKANQLNEAAREKQQEEAYKAELQYMQDYLKEYGTFQQQKLAIAQEYDEKIASSTNKWERKSLEQEKKQALSNINMEALKQQIDWSSVFGDLGGLLDTEIRQNLEALRTYMRSDEFRGMGAADQSVVVEAVDRLEGMLGGDFSGFSLKQIGDLANEFQVSSQRLVSAKEQEEKAYETLMQAQSAYEKALRDGSQAEIDKAEIARDMAKKTAEESSQAVQQASNEYHAAGNNLKDASDKAVGAINATANAISQIKSGSLASAYDGIKNLAGTLSTAFQGTTSKLLGNIASAMGGPIGELVGASLGLLDLLKDGISTLFVNLNTLAWDAVNGILSDVLSGDIILKPLKAVRDGLHGLADTLTFGGFDSWFGVGGNAGDVQASINRLSDRNELLQTSIEDLTAEMKASKGTQSVEAYRQAYNYQKEADDNYLRMAMEQARYSGSHHSWNYYWGGFTREQVDRLSSQIGRSWDGDIWNLSPEEMRTLRSNVDMWSQIQYTGKGGYGVRLTEKLDAYIDQAGKLEELTDQLYEGLTGISFDGMYGSFIDKLMDMKYDAQEASEDISGYFMRAMLSNKIGEMYSDKLKTWWEKFGKAMEDNDLTEGERDALAGEYLKYVDEAIKLRDNLASITGYGGDGYEGATQSPKAGGYNAMSQEQGTKLEGVFTSGLRHWSSIDEKMEDVIGKMNVAEGYLAQIEENTGESASHLDEIKAEIRRIIRDGLKIK